jgi:hypothetical protein
MRSCKEWRYLHVRTPIPVSRRNPHLQIACADGWITQLRIVFVSGIKEVRDSIFSNMESRKMGKEERRRSERDLK